MFRETVNEKLLGMWCFGAIVPTAVQLGGASWPMAGVACLLCFGAALAVNRWGRFDKKLFCVLRIIIIPVLLAQLLQSASGSWPGNDRMFVPLAILAVAAWSARKGIHAAARVGVVLFWAVLALYAMVLASGVEQVRLEWLAPEWGRANWHMIGVLLVPMLAVSLLPSGRMIGGGLYLSALFIVGGTAISAGVLSPKVATQMPDAFYQFSRSLGVTQRLEPLVSAGMTVGWFLLTSLLLSVAAQNAEQIKKDWGRRGTVIAGLATAALLLAGSNISMKYIAAGILVLWWIAPLFECAFSTRKGGKIASDLA